MSPLFHDGPPPPSAHVNLHLYRTPASKPLVFISLSPGLTSVATHYAGGRTSPCESPDCKHCDNSIPYRWHSYLTGWNPVTREKFLFEMTADVAAALELERDRYQSLRGLKLQFARPNGKPNGRITLKAAPGDVPTGELPDCPNVTRALAILWNLPQNAIEQPDQKRKHTTATVNSATIDRLQRSNSLPPIEPKPSPENGKARH